VNTALDEVSTKITNLREEFEDHKDSEHQFIQSINNLERKVIKFNLICTEMNHLLYLHFHVAEK